MGDAGLTTTATPTIVPTSAFVVVDILDCDGYVTNQRVQIVEIMKFHDAPIAAINSPVADGLNDPWDIADDDPAHAHWSPFGAWWEIAHDVQRSVREELQQRWPDASDGTIRIAETLLEDGWQFSLDDLRVAAVALDEPEGDR